MLTYLSNVKNALLALLGALLAVFVWRSSYNAKKAEDTQEKYKEAVSLNQSNQEAMDKKNENTKIVLDKQSKLDVIKPEGVEPVKEDTKVFSFGEWK